MNVWLWRDGDLVCAETLVKPECNTTTPPSGIIAETHLTEC